MSNPIERRLAAIERMIRPAPAQVNFEDILERLEHIGGLPHGAISRTPQESAAKGFTCMAEEVASLLGLELGEFKDYLRTR